MPRHVQTKTAQGYVPCRSAAIAPRESAPVDDGRPISSLDGEIVFDLLSSREFDRLEQEGSSEKLRPSASCNLVALGACMAIKQHTAPDGSYSVTGWEPDTESLLEFARGSGPIFGGDLRSEAIRDWGRAADAAMLASRIQEFVNGAAAIETLDSLCTTIISADNAAVQRIPRLYKTRFGRMGALPGESFTICSTTIAPTGAYRACFSQLPLVQRVGRKSCGHLYAFAQWEQPESDQAVSFYIVCFPHEITGGEFAFLGEVLSLSDELRNLSEIELGLAESGPREGDADEDLLITAVDEYGAAEEALEPEDRDILAALVRTMALAHLGGARVDPFQASEVTGIHSFDTLLCWLWYDFSSSLSRVAIGYCRQCGRPFSLVGHRGIRREFCSQKCKTDAKNERTKAQRDAARRAFSEDAGATIEDIARKAYGSDSKDSLRRARESLSTWVALKGELEDDIAQHGFGRSALFRRCVDMRLDTKNMLNSKRLCELESYLNRMREP